MPKKKPPLGQGKFVRFPRPVLTRLEAMAAADGRSLSSMVRVIVERALKEAPPAATGG